MKTHFLPLTCHFPQCVPNYKTLNTSMNNTFSTCAQNYSRFAKGIGGSRACPINNSKNRNTGILKPITVSQQTKYIKKKYPMKIICTNYI